MTFDAGNDLCLGFFQTFWDERLVPELPPHARVLEIGSAEADWLTPMKAARPDLYLVGIDQRAAGTRSGADELIRADVLTYDFESASFDAIIAVSMIEWAGTGKYGDPEDPEGDLHTLQRARQWIKPGGWLYFDVPWSQVETVERNPPMRAYTSEQLERLADQSGWERVLWRWFEGRIPNGGVHPDGPYMAQVLRPR